VHVTNVRAAVRGIKKETQQNSSKFIPYFDFSG